MQDQVVVAYILYIKHIDTGYKVNKLLTYNLALFKSKYLLNYLQINYIHKIYTSDDNKLSTKLKIFVPQQCLNLDLKEYTEGASLISLLNLFHTFVPQ